MSRAQLTSTVEQSSGGAVSPFLAGKNKIINGDFGIWQRGTSISLSTGTPVYAADRWVVESTFSAGSSTFSQVSFDYSSSPVAANAPISGYTAPYFGRLTAGSTASYFEISHKIEDVHTFAGQTVTYSLWAKASASTSMSMLIRQAFGSGGSANVDVSNAVTIGTTWQRYTFTTTLGSIVGKTIGSSSYLQIYLYATGSVTNSQTLDIWGVQVEAGSVATPFTTASNTLQGELALCQRYYYRISGGTAYNAFGVGQGKSTTVAGLVIPFPVTMRTDVTTLDYSLVAVFDGAGLYNASSAVINTGQTGKNSSYVEFTSSGLTQYRPYVGLFQNNSAGYIGFSAEL